MGVVNPQRYKICPEREAEWDAWVEKNHHLMQHPADFEARFVKEVLYFVTEITTDNIYPQYEFIDSNGSQRRIDFVILDSSRGLGLAIELDGLSKLSDYGKFEDLLKRQNDLLSKTRDKIFMLFRYANKRWLEHGSNVIGEITNELRAQEAAYWKIVEQNKISQQLERQLQAAERERNELKKQLIRLTQQFKTERDSITNEIVKKNSECKVLKTNREQTLQQLESFQVNLDQERQIRLQENVKLVQHDRDIAILTRLVTLLIVSLIIAILGVTTYILVNRSSEQNPTTVMVPYPIPQPAEPTRPSPTPYLPTPTPPPAPTPVPNEKIPQISTFEAGNHIGEVTTVCGILAQVNARGSFTYLNFDRPFPNNHFTGTIADAYANEFVGINTSVGSRICITGRIRRYGQKTGIALTSKSQIRK